MGDPIRPEDDTIRQMSDQSQLIPTDQRVDRRSFLRRLGAVTAAASAGTLDGVWRAAPVSGAVVGGHAARLPRAGEIQETDLAELTLVEAASLIQGGEVSPVELARAFLARVQALDPHFLAFNTVLEEALLAEAAAAEEALRSSGGGGPGGLAYAPLRGVPLAIKDNFFTAGVPTTANSHIYESFVPEWDAEAWARLRGAGALLLGKTQMGPLATSRATTPDGRVTTLNAWAPFDSDRSPGGSSSGSATAVALGMAPGSTGTQTGGSITNPAGAQGLTGLKPTMGRVSLRGIIPLTYTRDHPGPIARDARDAALLLQVMAGKDPADPRTLDQPSLPDLTLAAEPVRGPEGQVRLRWPTRIGVLPGYLDSRGDPPTEPGPDAGDDERTEYRYDRQQWELRQADPRARRAMLDTFRELGAEIVEVPFPDDWETLTSRDFNNARLPERAEPFMEHLRGDVRNFGVSLGPWINGLLMSGTEYLKGQRARLLLMQRVMDQVFSHCDVVVQTSPIPFDILGLPLISFPIGTQTARGVQLPVAGLLGGMPWAEDRLLSLAGGFQAGTDWHRRRAPSGAAMAPVGPEGDGDAERTRRRPLPDMQERPRLDVADVIYEAQ